MDELAAIDYQNPDYAPVWARRAAMLKSYRALDAEQQEAVKAFYADNIGQFIDDWAVTVDTRVANKVDPRTGKKRSPIMPLVLFPKQRALVAWILKHLDEGTPGILEKSRDVGASWVAGVIACSICVFRRDVSFGFGSYVEDKVDRSGDPDSLFYKLRMFLSYLPEEFRGGWELKKPGCSAHMRLSFPATGSSITGEAGDNVGRGGRKWAYFVDESAHLEHPVLVDASLAATTDVRIDLSSVNGMANPFAIKRHSGTYDVFTMHWRDDPRKDDAWAARKRAEVDPITWAQEFDLNYNASTEGALIPSDWIQAAVNAHVKLGLKPTGSRRSALDVADEGRDKNAQAFVYGWLLEHAESWSGVGMDIYETTERAFTLCDERGYPGFDYDGDGLGAGVRGDARKINEDRRAAKRKQLQVGMFRGSAAVLDPERKVRGPDGRDLDRLNKDMFLNFKAQAYWALRFRFQTTWRALQGLPYDAEDIISIGDFPERAKLLVELAQPVYLIRNGKILVDKVPDGVASPNLSDAVMMAYSPRRPGMKISDAALLGGLSAHLPPPGSFPRAPA